MSRVFVTGSTGLLGNNLVRALVARGYTVRALARSAEKAKAQLEGVPVEIVVGDLANVAAFAPALAGCDILFHTAAFFRDSYKGGNHWRELEATNVAGTRALMEAAYAAGIRKMVHTSSTAVLATPQPGAVINETHRRPLERADHYFRSKILSEEAVDAFLTEHPDFHATFVLPAWMWGPGDAGPTSAGQLALDVARNKLPGLPPSTFSVVDARDVAQAHIAAAEHGRRGERYLAAGKAVSMRELVPIIGKAAHVKTPTRSIPLGVLYVIAFFQEAFARLFGKPALLSLAAVKLMASEGEDSASFDTSKAKRELGYTNRPLEQTIADTVDWYVARGLLKAPMENGQLATARS